MYAHMQGNTVGQLFDEIPQRGTYQDDFIDAIILLPDGVTSGWTRDPDTGEFSPPAPPEPEEPEISQEIKALQEEFADMDAALQAILEVYSDAE